MVQDLSKDEALTVEEAFKRAKSSLSEANLKAVVLAVLPIFKWAQKILDFPVDEGAQVIFCQNFFKHFFSGSSLQG